MLLREVMQMSRSSSVCRKDKRLGRPKDRVRARVQSSSVTVCVIHGFWPSEWNPHSVVAPVLNERFDFILSLTSIRHPTVRRERTDHRPDAPRWTGGCVCVFDPSPSAPLISTLARESTIGSPTARHPGTSVRH